MERVGLSGTGDSPEPDERYLTEFLEASMEGMGLSGTEVSP
jgi:hypothetical protein